MTTNSTRSYCTHVQNSLLSDYTALVEYEETTSLLKREYPHFRTVSILWAIALAVKSRKPVRPYGVPEYVLVPSGVLSPTFQG